MTHARPAFGGGFLLALGMLGWVIPAVSAQSTPAPTPEATIGVPGTDGWGPAGAPVPTKGRIPEDAADANGTIDRSKVPDFVGVWGRDGVSIAGYVAYRDLDPPDGSHPRWYQQPPTPVYGGDLRTLVGFMFDGKGFVPLGVAPKTVQGFPVEAGPSIGPAPASPRADIEPPSVWNDTSLTVTVVVDGEALLELPPATLAPVAVTSPPPWYVEVRAPDSFRLATGYISGASPASYRTDLSCGRIDITWRTVILGPMNGPGQPGDCGPSAPTLSPSPAASPGAGDGTARTTEDGFALTLTLPRTTWRVGEAIDGTAELLSTADKVVRVGGSGDGLTAFAFRQVGGTHEVDPVWASDCRSYRLLPGVPRSTGITKSGGFSEGDPDAPFLRDFLADPQVRLPVGTWDIGAIASFVEGGQCQGASRSLEATVRIKVVP